MLKIHRNIEPARVVDAMARATRIYILMIKVKQVVFFSSSQNFQKEIENMFSVFLSSNRNTRGSLGELEKAMKTPSCRLVFPQHLSSSQTSTRVSMSSRFLSIRERHS